MIYCIHPRVYGREVPSTSSILPASQEANIHGLRCREFEADLRLGERLMGGEPIRVKLTKTISFCRRYLVKDDPFSVGGKRESCQTTSGSKACVTEMGRMWNEVFLNMVYKEISFPFQCSTRLFLGVVMVLCHFVPSYSNHVVKKSMILCSCSNSWQIFCSSSFEWGIIYARCFAMSAMEHDRYPKKYSSHSLKTCI